MKHIDISINDKIACQTNDEQIVCGNNDYEVRFTFDDEWDGQNLKTALFVFSNKTISVVFEGDVCQGVIIEKATLCGIGVFAGNLKTSTPAYVGCVSSIRDIAQPLEPLSEDEYNKIMDFLNTAIPSGGKAGYILIKKSDEDYDTEWSADLINYGEKIDTLEAKINELERKIKELTGAITTDIVDGVLYLGGDSVYIEDNVLYLEGISVDIVDNVLCYSA